MFRTHSSDARKFSSVIFSSLLIWTSSACSIVVATLPNLSSSLRSIFSSMLVFLLSARYRLASALVRACSIETYAFKMRLLWVALCLSSAKCSVRMHD